MANVFTQLLEALESLGVFKGTDPTPIFYLACSMILNV